MKNLEQKTFKSFKIWQQILSVFFMPNDVHFADVYTIQKM